MNERLKHPEPAHTAQEYLKAGVTIKGMIDQQIERRRRLSFWKEMKIETLIEAEENLIRWAQSVLKIMIGKI